MFRVFPFRYCLQMLVVFKILTAAYLVTKFSPNLIIGYVGRIVLFYLVLIYFHNREMS